MKLPLQLAGMLGIIHRDLRLAWRRRADIAAALVFFMIISSLFPLSVGTNPELLRTIGPGVVWVAALLASLLTLNRLFADDYQDGSLEQLLLSATSLPLLVFGKSVAHWLVSGVPLIVATPVLAVQFDLSVHSTLVLVLSLLLGTPLLSFVGAIGSALTVGARGATTLLAILILPLYIPILIFGAGAVQASINGMTAQGHLSLLAALLALALFFAPWAAATALRIAFD